MVLQFGLAPDYVLDQMQIYEIIAIMENSHYRSKENWEQARLIAYLIAQTHSQKKLELSDIIEFKWEREDKPVIPHEEITQEDIEELERQAEIMKKYL